MYLYTSDFPRRIHTITVVCDHTCMMHTIYLFKVVKGEGEWTHAYYNMMSHDANPSAG